MASSRGSRCLRGANRPAPERETDQSTPASTGLARPGAVAPDEEMRAGVSTPPFAPFSFTLPWPLTLNRRFGAVIINGKPRLLLSREARRSTKVGEVELLMQRVPRRALAVPIALHIEATPPAKARGRDLDNILKSTLDLLTRMRVIADDRFVDELLVRRMVPRGDGQLALTVLPRR